MTATTAERVPAPAGPSLSARAYDLVFRAFCSLRLTVVVILLMTAGCLVGMWVDQTRTFEEHSRAWMQDDWKFAWLGKIGLGALQQNLAAAHIKYRIFTALEFHDVFHSWWFGVIILVLALNLIACSIERLPKIWIDIHHPDPLLTPRKERGIRHKTRLVAQDAEAFVTAFTSAVGRADPAVTSADGDTRYVFTEKHKWARTGVYVVHTALLFIMFGSMATTSLGFDGTIGIVEGSDNRYAFGKGPAGLRYRMDLGFQVHCTDFRLKQFVDGAPMDFESDLFITQNGREVARKTIQVNDPLEYGGYTFYQASYQPVPGDEQVRLAIGPRGGARKTYSVSPGTRIDVEGTDTAYIPLEIIPQYADLGPAVRVQEVRPGQPPTSFVLFQNFPDFDENVRRGNLALHYKGSDKTYMTGIQVGKVPGVSVVFAGFAFMFVGLYMAFFMSHRRYWARLDKRADGSWDVTVAGAAKRHMYAFEEEYQALQDNLARLPGVAVVGPGARV